jgi:DNA-binding response OmpR family regulator
MKALVISGELDTARLLYFKLGKGGYEVLSARTGDKGIEQVREEKPDVVVLDPQAPGAEGADFVARLKGKAKQAPVVLVLSSEAGIADIGAAFAQGADDFVAEPFSPQGLLERMQVTLVRTGRLRAVSEEA